MSEQSRTRTFIEIFGAAGVVLSLIFVGMELRHANNLAEAEAVQAINVMISDSLLAAISNESAMEDAAQRFNISVSDARRGFRNAYFLNTYEAAWKAYERGIVDEDMFSVYLRAACADLFRDNRAENFIGIGGATWAETSAVFNSRFIGAIKAECPEVFEVTQ